MRVALGHVAPLLPVVPLVLALGMGCGSGSAPPVAQPGGGASLAPAGDPNLAVTVHALVGAPEGAPLVATKARAVTVDGTKVAEAPAAAATAKKPPRIEGLFRALHARAEASKKAQPGAASPARAAFTFDREDPASLVKAVLFTAASAGYPSGAMLVRVPGAKDGGLVPGHLRVEAREEPPKAERELHLGLSSKGVVLLKWQEGSKMLGEIIPSDVVVAKLATTIERGWNERGLHREPNDNRLDQAVLKVENDTPYALLVVTLDALHATKRKLAGASGEELVPAFEVTLISD
jgi:hypothetical protein